MTTRTFTLTLDDGDRLMILTALGFSAMHLMTASAPIDMRRPIDALIQKLSSANGQDAPEFFPKNQPIVVDPKSGTDAARAVLKPPTPVPPQPHDYFAADRSGNVPAVAPKGAQLQFLDVQATKESIDRKHLKVVFKGGKANCFDRQLWPHIVRQTGHAGVPLWITVKGDYMNIVGVRWITVKGDSGPI